MKVYEYKEIYTKALYELLQNGDINLSEMLFKIECVDEYAKVVGWDDEIDFEKFISTNKTT